LNEVGRDPSGKMVVSVDPRYFRPTEVETLLGDASKAKQKLGWTPQTSFCRSGRRDGGSRSEGGQAGWLKILRACGKTDLVAGHRGMVGSAIVRRLDRETCTILTATHAASWT
jgi:nucleoside-diphosphate-sugar epimerase